ncbi:MAG TPA: signal peptidase II [Longimicrobium sp.]|nr:signal peptidase II [Longimicrobium sp.]
MSENHPIRKAIRRAMGDRRGVLHPDRSPGRRRADREPMRGWIPTLIIALLVAGADWTTKFLIARSIELDDLREVIPGKLAFWHVRNPAMVLGLWDNFPLTTRKVIAILAAVLGGLVLLQILGRGHRFPRRHRAWAWAFVGLVLGGMLGNLGERVVHWGVTDFISFRYGEYWLPPGNLADLALFLSMPLSLFVIGFELAGRRQRNRDDAAQASLAAEPAAIVDPVAAPPSPERVA